MTTSNGHNGYASLGDYGRHRGVSRQAVSRAVQEQRLKDSIVFVDGVPKVCDFAKADAEWAANTDYTRAPDRAVVEQPSFLETPKTRAFSAEELSVFLDDRLIVFAWQRFKDRHEFDNWFVVPMTRETARVLALQLLQLAT